MHSQEFPLPGFREYVTQRFLLAKIITPSFRRQKNDRMAVKIKKNKEFEEGGALLPIFTPFAY